MRLFTNRIGFAVALAGVVALGAYLIALELRSSRMQAHWLAEHGRKLSYRVDAGPNHSIRFPSTGPYDFRLGYVELPGMLERLGAEGFGVTAQARVSPEFADLMERGLNAPYREKTLAGLSVLDCRERPIYRSLFPRNVYPGLEAVPPVLVQTLMYIEDRKVLDSDPATRNPAIDSTRLGRAVVDQVLHVFQRERDTSGGSTLATQIEKYRHSAEGRTASGSDKLQQMASASVRAYLKGPDTSDTRRQIVLDYLNTVPLTARAGYGEISGIGDGMQVWYGRDFNEVNRLLADTTSAPSQERALAYKQALSLMIAQRRPTYYLRDNVAGLETHTNTYLRLLTRDGIIPEEIRDAALNQPLRLSENGGKPPPVSFVANKAATAVRTHLADILDVPRLYDLDRLDLTVSSTLDARLQRSVTAALRELRKPDAAKAAGLIAPQLLATGDPAKVMYSFTLYEAGQNGNRVRVQTDNYDQPLDINEGTKLDLGSTAKLRTFINYLEIVDMLHKEYGQMERDELKRVEVGPKDHITRWAVDYLAHAQDRSLEAMLDASLERKYSASPGEQFFTGGGMHTFENFDRRDNGRVLSVREATRRSVNLVYIRLMRDVAHYYMFRIPGSSAHLAADADDPIRHEYLARFADKEGRKFLLRYFRKYQGKSVEQAEALLVKGIRPTSRRLAAIFRTIAPQADRDDLARFANVWLPEASLNEAALARLYDEVSPQRLGLADRGYLAGVHPLELWVVGYLRQHADATFSQVADASVEERQEVYGWLFKTRHKSAQDSRIRQLLEAESFQGIYRAWKRLGYPFDSLVPSYATSIGASADRPAALAELMGILVNDGVRMPTLRIERLEFGANTPFESRLAYGKDRGERVLPVEIARLTRRVLAEVVEQGTAQRLKGTFKTEDGKFIPVGGKTGTGDHRFSTFARNGALVSSRVVSRSGTFVFYLGDRYFGTLTAYVYGPEAASYAFTSGLPVQILKVLAPSLNEGLGVSRGDGEGSACEPELQGVGIPPQIASSR